MIIFRKNISYILVFSFMVINAMDNTFSASAEPNIPICTNEGIKYLLADGSVSDSKNNKIYHDGCMECITCDNSFYKNEKLTSFLLINFIIRKFFSICYTHRCYSLNNLQCFLKLSFINVIRIFTKILSTN